MIHTTPKIRISAIDALRGFALFGIVIAHYCDQYYAGMLPAGHENFNVKNGVDGVLGLLHNIFVFGKFFTIFSFLFGVSFGIQIFNAQEKGQAFAGRFAWRLLVLLAIGIADHIFYRGDILMIYALLGFPLLLFRRAGNKMLLLLGLFFALNTPGFLVRTVGYLQSLGSADKGQISSMGSAEDPMFKQLQQDAIPYYAAVKAGDWMAIAAANIKTEFVVKMGFQVISGRLSITFGLFLLGLLAARQNLFQQVPMYKKLIKKWMWACSIFCLLLIVLYGAMGNALFAVKGLAGLLLSLAADAFGVLMSVVYVAAFLLLWQNASWQRRLNHLTPVGRMGLSMYLLQNVVGLLVFYGYGFNLLDVIGNGYAILIGCLVFILQIWLAKWWMRRYYYGPVEWLWRSATYGTMAVFRKPLAVQPK